MFSRDFREFVELLNQNKVEYLIAGGYAVGVHGHPRYTGDLDVWLNPTPENADRALNSVNQFGFSSYKLTRDDFLKQGNVIQLGYPPFRIDLLTTLDGVTFDECYKNRKEVQLDKLLVNFIGYNDLLKNKKATGRPRDIDDIENLS